MRSTRDRIRHALLFEVIGLALIIPLGTALFGLHTSEMGVIGVGSAIAATVWNYVYNLASTGRCSGSSGIRARVCPSAWATPCCSRPDCW